METPQMPPAVRGRRKLSDGEDSQSTLGPSKTVNFRIPLRLYRQVERLAASIYQPAPVVFRAALHEYVQRHRPKRGVTAGLALVWPDDPAPVSAPVTQPAPDLTPAPAPLSEE